MTSRIAGALLASLLLAACDDDGPSGPSPTAVAGVYEAVELRYRADDVDRNLIQEGGFIDLTLHADGVSEGAVYVPSLEAGAPLEGDLDGTWDVDGNTIRLEHSPATFLRDVPLAWDDDGFLRASFYTADGRLDVTLERGVEVVPFRDVSR